MRRSMEPKHGYRFQFGMLVRDPQITSPPTRWHFNIFENAVVISVAVTYGLFTGLVCMVRDTFSHDEKGKGL